MEGRKHRVVTARPFKSDSGLAITDREAALLGWIAGDGWQVGPRTRQPMTWHVLHVRAKRWDYFQDLIEGDDNIRFCRERDATVERRLRAPYIRDLFRRAGITHPRTDAMRLVLAMSDSQRSAWLDALVNADGHFSDGCTQLSQKEGPLADAAIMAIFMSGRRPSVYRDERYGNTVLTIGVTEPEIGMRLSHAEEAGVAEVWCVTTDLGTWTAFEGQNLFLTGNSLPGSKMASAGPDWETNPQTQITWGLRYIKDRYGSPAAAWAHSEAVGWYDRGGSVPDNGIAINTSGATEEVLTNAERAAFRELGQFAHMAKVHATVGGGGTAGPGFSGVLKGTLKITNWSTGMAQFQAVAADVYDGKKAFDGSMARMG
jgi:hypothetical protein